MHRTVIVDTSPIFYLHRIRQLHIFEKLYSKIIAPGSVATELEEGRLAGEDVPDIKSHQWIEIRGIAVPSLIKMIPDLGSGEAEVLALGLEESNHLLIIDDALARKIAGLQGMKLTGTAGVLLRAKKEGLIKYIRPEIERLKEAGFYLSDQLTDELLKIADEF